jgi:preprotein translocase subunit SecE
VQPIQYLREVREELRKVVWPEYSQVRRYAFAVLAIVALVTLYVFALDSLFGVFSGWLYRD